jgi:response regulator RpfG family c-di-GMP phosphodiesterase
MAKILIVDDDSAIRVSLKKILELEGHEIGECENGTEALELIHTSKPDLILLDLNLPGVSGEHIASSLKTDEKSRMIPVIVLTGESMVQTHLQLLNIGVEEFLLKPFSKPHLLARVRSLLKTKTLNDQLIAAFSAVESLESFHTLLIKRLTDEPLAPNDFLELALQQCLVDKPEMGSPNFLFLAMNQKRVLSGQSMHYKEQKNVVTRLITMERQRLLNILEPYEQSAGIYYSEAVPEEILKLIWPEIAGCYPLVGVKEAGLWVFASGYSRSVGYNDSRWLASIARQYQLYLAHLNQVAETEKAFHYTLEALARACEVFDEEVGGHIQRVNQFSRIISKALGCHSSFIKEISVSAMVHDVGKIMISKDILNKRGPLTDNETRDMKRHPELGVHILGENPRLGMAREIARCHHEHYDGTGYPEGLKGEKIPLSARIVALADVYDALRSERPYKKAFSHDEAINFIKNGDGKTNPSFFDPAVLKAFLNSVNEMDAIFKRLSKKGFVMA